MSFSSFASDLDSDLNKYFSPNKANLFPILPSTIRDSRYSTNVRVPVSPTIIPFGAHCVTAPSYQSQGWSISVHPEGKRYAHAKSQAGITVVTEAHVTNPGVSDQLNAWVDVIFNLAAENDVNLPESSDLFLEIHQDSNTCHYYFAEHGLRTIFWMQAHDSANIGLPDCFSSGHLQHSLEENYWVHAELFPETASQYSLAALNELLVIFLHARADALTSATPTFPYSAEESEKFIGLLERGKDRASNPYVTTLVARLWAIVANYRFFIHFGEDHCRLSSEQSILAVPERKRSLILTIVSNTFLFGLPNQLQAKFEDLWVDQVTYISPWPEYFHKTIKGLSFMVLWYLALLIFNTLTIKGSSIPGFIHSSLLLCFFGLVVTLVLWREQQRLVDTPAAMAAVYLDSQNTADYGFQPIAIVHSLPEALFVWALLLSAIQGYCATFAGLSPYLPLVALFPMAGICACIWRVLHSSQKPFEKQVVKESVPVMSPIPAEDHKKHRTSELMV